MPPTIDVRGDHTAILTPEQVGQLVVQPVARQSIAMQVASVVTTSSETFRIPIVTDDPTAGWYADGAEIADDRLGTDEINVAPAKVAALTIISNELAQDSSPDAQRVVGEALARDLARSMDAAFFGSVAPPAPSGLGALTGIGTVDDVGTWADLDPFLEAQYAADAQGRTITGWVTNHTDALELAKLRDATDSNRPLLGDPVEGTRRRLAGADLYVSPYVPAGTVYGIPRDVAMIVRRTDTTLTVDASRYFERDSLGVRATMRVGFGFPHPAAIVRVTLDAIGSGT